MALCTFAQPNDGQCLSLDLYTNQLASLPLAALQAGGSSPDVSCNRHEQSNRMFRSRIDISLRTVHHNDSQLCCCFQVDIVDTHARSGNYPQSLASLHE